MDYEEQGAYQNEICQIRAEIAARDYRALKAMKLGVGLDDIYPGESAWYNEQLDRIHEQEALLEASRQGRSGNSARENRVGFYYNILVK
jgi:hypothetical protein